MAGQTDKNSVPQCDITKISNVTEEDAISGSLLLFCDGSVRSGGRGGVGYVLATPDGYPLVRRGEPLPFAVRSSNEAEYHALIRGLEEALRLGAESIECYCDSSLVVEQVHGRFACNAPHLQQLRAQVLELLSRFAHWTLERIPSERNQLAHCYATIASTQNRKRFFWQHPRKRGEHKTNTQEEVQDTMIFEFKDYEPLPTGSYPVRVLDVVTKNGQFGEQVQFTLEVTSGSFAGQHLKAWCNPSGSKNGKLYRWARALLQTEDLSRLDTQQLVGKQALAQVVQQQAANGNIYSRVQDLLPMKKTHQEEDAYDPFLEEED